MKCENCCALIPYNSIFFHVMMNMRSRKGAEFKNKDKKNKYNRKKY